MKKILSVLLVAAMLLISFTAIHTSASTNSTPTFARLTIFAYYDPDASDPNSSSSSSLTNTGHAFIVIENFSDRRINAGRMALDYLEAAALGTWDLDDTASTQGHCGIWYNLEMDYLFRSDKDHFHSVSMNINQSQLNTLNAFISERDSWSLINNCSKFARDAWNTLNPDNQLITGFPSTPLRLIEAMQELSSYDTDFRPIYRNTVEGFYDGGVFVSSPRNVWLSTPVETVTE